MIDLLTRLNDLVNKIRGTNFKMVAVIILTFMVFAWAMFAPMLVAAFGKTFAVDVTVLGMLLAFLAAAWGISYQQFSKERTTDYGYVERAKVPPAPAPVSTTTETVGPSTTTTTAPAPEGDKG